MFKSKLFVYLLSLSLIATIVPGNSFISARSLDSTPGINAEPAQQSGQASQALKQGRLLLKRGQSDQALVSLQNALNLFKAANDSKGVAAANDALGDLYVRQGQYSVAINYYRSAHDAFKEAASKQGALETTFGMPDNEYNANLMLAKIGDTNYRMGKVSEATTAYEEMRVEKPDPSKLTGNVSASGVKKSGGGLFGGGGGILGKIPGGGGSAASTAASTADTAAGVAGTIKGAIELYRQTIIYSAYSLGLGRIDYFNNNLDSSKKHFEDALSTASLALIGKFGQSRRVRAAGCISILRRHPGCTRSANSRCES